MLNNKNLQKAYIAQNDEFYTELSEIEGELSNYSDKFKGKVIFCNCDDPLESNFVKFFLMHFNSYGLKALYALGYKTSPILEKELDKEQNSFNFLYISNTIKYLKADQKDLDLDSVRELLIGETRELLGDEIYKSGDFRSIESVKILKQCDIVVTNPPFSLFREYLAQIIEYKKDFLILGNLNSLMLKNIFPLFSQDKIWLGCQNGTRSYVVSLNYANENFDKVYLKDGKYYIDMRNTRWYTNLDHYKRHVKININPEHTYIDKEYLYPHYDNFEAVNVGKVANIPFDYLGVMGVPVNFLDSYCPEQFEIIGLDRYFCPKEVLTGGRLTIDKKSIYARILIKLRNS